MPSEILSSKEIYTSISLSKKVIDKAIITFMLSTGIKSDYLIHLTLNDLLRGCGKNVNDKNSLKELLDEDPLKVLPAWTITDEESHIKIIFNSYESSFYLFLYLKGRFNDIGSCEEPLFASGKDGSKYTAKSIREMITKNTDNKNFRQTTLINKFENVCNYIRDEEVRNLFLGKTTKYDQHNKLFENEQYKKMLVEKYHRILPHLTAGYYMYNHLKFYSSTRSKIKDDYKNMIKNYFEDNFVFHFRDFSDIDKGKLLSHAYNQAKADIKDNHYEESDLYYNNLLKRAEILTVFHNSKYHVSEFERHEDSGLEFLSTEQRVDDIYKCITELEIKDNYNLDPKDIREAIINQLASEDCLREYYTQELCEKVTLLSIFEVLNI